MESGSQAKQGWSAIDQKQAFVTTSAYAKPYLDPVTVRGQVQKCFQLDSLRRPTSTPVGPFASTSESPVL